MKQPTLFRKRYMPMEVVVLKDDVLLFQDEEKMITKWQVFRPKANFSHGVSCYYLQEGYKVSKFLNDADELVYYYCDIVDIEYDPIKNSYLFTDLLADVIVYPDGFVKVVDLAELADALEEHIITAETLQTVLRRLEALLEVIYDGKFMELTKNLEIEA